MLSIRNIRTVARYERKILFRSWFFRIFAILSLVILGFFNGAMIFQKSPFSWDMRALPSAVIYNSMAMLNIVQSIIAIFLASDFMKRDKKLDTAEVLFIRPMSNSDYVMGKTWGIVSLFFYLNLLVMLLAAILILASNEIAFTIMPFIYYFLLLSIPSLVFILGLSFFLMGLLKNQAITFLILLAYIAANLFYLANKAYFMFDYLAFQRPFVYSDIIGFSDLSGLVYHRMVYLLLGVAFIFATILMLKRIEQTRLTPIVATAGTIVALLGALFCSYQYLNPLLTSRSDREKMVELSVKYYAQPTASILKHNISLVHGKKLAMESKMNLKNNSAKELDELVFTLNPSLKVEEITLDGAALKFSREQHIVKVELPKHMQIGEELTLNMKYGGNISQAVCYLDAKEEKFYDYSTFFTIRSDHQYAVERPNYLLLTQENIWYPVAGVKYDPKRPAVFKQQFTRFSLDVTTDSSLVAISQGKMEKTGPGKYHFKSRDPLPQISLTIGNYEIRSTNADGLNLSLAFLKGHNYFDTYLKDCGDTLNSVILDFLDNFERPLSMVYPYPNFTIVEVPLQFKAIQHSWTSALENSQPQMVFIPERGYDVRQADFKSSLHFAKQDNDRNNSGKTDAEMQADAVKGFLQTVLAAENSEIQFGNIQEGTQSNPYSIYPNYYYFTNFISSEKCPVMNYAFESYLRKATEDPRQMFMMRVMGIGDDEKANLMLNGSSLKKIIATSDDPVALNRVLKVKGGYLLSWIQKQVGDQDFDKFLLKYLYDNSYRDISYNEFAGVMKDKFGINLDDFLDDWYSSDKLPAYKVQNFELYQTIDKNQVVYVAQAKVTNYSNVAGLVKFSFRAGGGGGGRGGGGFNPFAGASSSEDTDERIFLIGSNETHEIQMVLSQQPRGMTFNTLISKNLPTAETFNRRNPEENNNIKAEEYDRVVPFNEIANANEIIVDNEDHGFSVFDPSANNPIKKMFQKDKKENEYVGMGFGQSPTSWSLTANSDFYGDFIHSAMFVRSGSGSKSAIWKTPLKKPGYYDVFVHNIRERGGRGRGPDGDRGNRDPKGSYYYTIYHDDGVEEVELPLKDVEGEGWNLLGNFYISSDSAKVVLSDKSESSRVIADAVKWVKEGK